MKKSVEIAIVGAVCGLFAGVILFGTVSGNTSSDEYCMSCHVHTDADAMWKQSVHVRSHSGVKTGCAECHLPPEGTRGRLFVKARVGMKDVTSYLLKKHENIDWEAKSQLEYAQRIVYNSSCTSCHSNIYPEGISDDGITAHLHYDDNAGTIQCISCHLDAGHYNPSYSHSKMTSAPVVTSSVIYDSPAEVSSFEDYTETVPGTGASIRMVAVPGGKFLMGSPSSEPFRGEDEGPVHEVEVSDFFMAETEITWDQYWAFYSETMSEGRIDPAVVYENNSRTDLDAVTGPTPPFGIPDQGWGMGSRPAITMTHYAAETFCQWLSLKTGRSYRLPTEAEWEYAARGGVSSEQYPFGGSARDYSSKGFLRGIFGADTAVISRYAIYELDSRGRTAEPSAVLANPLGLKNLQGNVWEYCSDWYSPDAYKALSDGVLDPTGPASGTEYVIRGGCYSSDASLLRSAARAHTENDAWLLTDPQNPKSIWWYSDIKGIGFRVVCKKQ